MCLSINALADTDTRSAGIYISITGTLTQASPSFMATTTSIITNPDNAYLLTVVEYKDGDQFIMSNCSQSIDGAKSLSYNSPIYIDVLYEPDRAFCSHNVQGGSKALTGYAAYTYEDVVLGR